MNERTAILTDRKSGGAAVLHILNEFYIFPVYVVRVFVGSQSPSLHDSKRVEVLSSTFATWSKEGLLVLSFWTYAF